MKKTKLKNIASKIASYEGKKIISPYYENELLDIRSALNEKLSIKELRDIKKIITKLIISLNSSNNLNRKQLSSFLEQLELLSFDFKEYEKQISALSAVDEKLGNKIFFIEEKLKEKIEPAVTDKEVNKEPGNKEILALSEGIAQMKIELLTRIANLGGGSMNRQIKIGGTNYLTRYTDINLIGDITAVDNDTQKRVDITFAGSGTIETPAGTVNSVNTSFTVTGEPQYVVADGITYFDGAGYTYSALTITMDVPPSSYLRAFI